MEILDIDIFLLFSWFWLVCTAQFVPLVCFQEFAGRPDLVSAQLWFQLCWISSTLWFPGWFGWVKSFRPKQTVGDTSAAVLLFVSEPLNLNLLFLLLLFFRHHFWWASFFCVFFQLCFPIISQTTAPIRNLEVARRRTSEKSRRFPPPRTSCPTRRPAAEPCPSWWLQTPSWHRALRYQTFLYKEKENWLNIYLFICFFIYSGPGPGVSRQQRQQPDHRDRHQQQLWQVRPSAFCSSGTSWWRDIVRKLKFLKNESKVDRSYRSNKQLFFP